MEFLGTAGAVDDPFQWMRTYSVMDGSSTAGRPTSPSLPSNSGSSLKLARTSPGNAGGWKGKGSLSSRGGGFRVVSCRLKLVYLNAKHWDWGSVISLMRIAFSRWLCWSFVLFLLLVTADKRQRAPFLPNNAATVEHPAKWKLWLNSNFKFQPSFWFISSWSRSSESFRKIVHLISNPFCWYDNMLLWCSATNSPFFSPLVCV